MTRYRSAALFIRMQRWLAMLLIPLGLILIGGTLAKTYTELEKHRYKPNEKLLEASQDLGVALLSVREVLADINAAVGDDAAWTNSWADVTVFDRRCRTDSDFAALFQELGRAGVEVKEHQRRLVSVVDKKINFIEAQMGSHAAILRSEVGGSNAASRAEEPKPPVAGDVTRLTRVAQDLPGLLVTTMDLSARLHTLDGASEFLGVLADISEKEENRQVLREAREEISRLKSLLEPRTEGAGSSKPDAATEQMRSLGVEKVLEKLGKARKAIGGALKNGWVVDERLNRVQTMAKDASDKCRKQQLEQFGDMVDGGMVVLLIVVVAIALAFLIRVVADFLQSHLDTGDATCIIASAYGQTPGDGVTEADSDPSGMGV